MGSPTGISEPMSGLTGIGEPIGELINQFYSSYN
jgi:hypothetical protein